MQKSMAYVLVINSKMPTFVGILKLIIRTNDIDCCSVQENCLICLHFAIYDVEHKKKVYNDLETWYTYVCPAKIFYFEIFSVLLESLLTIQTG